jgi:hypothetical protein
VRIGGVPRRAGQIDTRGADIFRANGMKPLVTQLVTRRLIEEGTTIGGMFGGKRRVVRSGVPGQNRTAGLALRRRSLYPTELRGQRVTNFLVYQLLIRLSCSFVARRRLLYLTLACNRIATGGIKWLHGVL